MSNGVAITTLRERIIKQGIEDSWWLSVDGQPQEKPLRIRSIEMMLREAPDSEYHILNCAAADRGDLDWQELYLTPRLRTPQPAATENLPTSGTDSRLVAELAELKARLNLLETNQAKLLETVADLKAMIRQQSRNDRQERYDRDRDEDWAHEDESHEPREDTRPSTRPLTKAEQLRAKLRNPSIRLVG